MNKFAKNRVWGPEPKLCHVEQYTPPSRDFISIAGPCSIENDKQIDLISNELGRIGVSHMRGGVFRAGTYPGQNFGLISDTLIKHFSDSAHNNNMKCVLEVLDYEDKSLHVYDTYADVFQVGARQMQNYTLLHLLAKRDKPIFLKRNMGSNMFEFLGAAEHLLSAGAKEIYLIERGSSTFMNHVRWDLSISIIPAIKQITQIPVIIDASHGTGRRDLVEPMLYAGIAAGAQGFLLETHPNPDKSLSDSDQAYPLESAEKLINHCFDLKEFMERRIYQ